MEPHEKEDHRGDEDHNPQKRQHGIQQQGEQPALVVRHFLAHSEFRKKSCPISAKMMRALHTAPIIRSTLATRARDWAETYDVWAIGEGVIGRAPPEVTRFY